MDVPEPVASFLDEEVTINFLDPAIVHDRVLLVDGKKFYVNSGHLSMFSEYFNSLFNSAFKEKNLTEIELADVPHEEFAIFLKMLYPFGAEVTDENLVGLFELSNRFLVTLIYQKCTQFIGKPSNELELKNILDRVNVSHSLVLKNYFESFAVDLYRQGKRKDLLEIANTYQMDELKTFIDGDLADCFPSTTDEGLLIKLMKLSLKYDLQQLKRKVMIKISNTISDIKATDDKFKIPRFLQNSDLLKDKDFYASFFETLLENPPVKKDVKKFIIILDEALPIDGFEVQEFLQEYLREPQLEKSTAEHLQKLQNFLIQFSFFLYQEDTKISIDKVYELLKYFPGGGSPLLDIKNAMDMRYAQYLQKKMEFHHVEFVLKQSFVQTKKCMAHYLTTKNAVALKKKTELISAAKSSPIVAEFVRQYLTRNAQKLLIMPCFFK